MLEEKKQANIFDSESLGPNRPKHPLAVRMRPRSLDEIVGQDHIVGAGCFLPRLIKSDNFGSLLFCGPPGCGKTSLAEVISIQTKSKFIRINAVLSNVAELRDILRLARYEKERQTILFIDEIHRFNKSQQDLLLPDVEAGTIRLIGATTHNPGFYINAPLLSRSHLFHLEPVDTYAITTILKHALVDKERGLGLQRCTADAKVFNTLATFAGGDLRRALNFLETLVLSQPLGSHIDIATVKTFARERHIRYDRDEDEHYDHISAMIKSIRGSDPDAALYWAFKMLQGGEDPRFIARRLIILASEDIGLANSNALSVAANAFEACERVGVPECEYNLSHAILYLSTSPKSNSAAQAMHAVKKSLQDSPVQEVPVWLRDAHAKTSKTSEHGKDYLYSHEYPSGVSGQEYMLKPHQFYKPGDAGAEVAIAQRMKQLKQLKAALKKKNAAKQD